MIGVALYRDAEEILTESLAVFRDRGDADTETGELRLLGTIRGVKNWATRSCPDDPDS
jgi:hypothetical protein